MEVAALPLAFVAVLLPFKWLLLPLLLAVGSLLWVIHAMSVTLGKGINVLALLVLAVFLAPKFGFSTLGAAVAKEVFGALLLELVLDRASPLEDRRGTSSGNEAEEVVKSPSFPP